MSSRSYSRTGIIQRLFNQPLAVMPETAAIVLGAVGRRLDVAQLFVATDGRTLSLPDLEGMAGGELLKIEARGGVDRRAKMAPAEHLMMVHNGVAHIGVRGETVAENGIGPMSGFTGYDGIVAQVQSADADPAVRGILLDIDSPGGEVSGLYECAGILMARRGTKPMRALIRGVGASAAYALASCADDITLHDIGVAGSIGTIAMHVDYSQALENEGVKVTMIAEGEHKADGNPFEALPPEVLKDIRAHVAIANSRFIQHVAAARKMSTDDVIAQQARVYRGQEAVKAGLVDKIMSWQDSMDEFEQQVNGQATRQVNKAPSGARSSKGTNMSIEATAPAANQQPEFSQADIDAARVEGHTEGVTAGQTSERARFVALAELDGGSNISASLSVAMSEGTSAGDFAIGLAKAGKAGAAAALTDAKADAASLTDLESGAEAVSASLDTKPANRGKAYADKKAAAKASASA